MTQEGMGGARVAITGIGSTPFGVFPGEDAYSLGSAALRPAMREAGVSAADIDGLIVCRIPDYQRFGELHGVNPQFALNLPGQGRMAAIALQIGATADEHAATWRACVGSVGGQGLAADGRH